MIGEAPSNGWVQVIATKLPEIVVIGLSGLLGTYAAKTWIGDDKTE